MKKFLKQSYKLVSLIAILPGDTYTVELETEKRFQEVK